MTTNTNEMNAAIKRVFLEIAYLDGKIKSEIKNFQDNDEIVWASVSAMEHLRDYMVEILEYSFGTDQHKIQRNLDKLHM